MCRIYMCVYEWICVRILSLHEHNWVVKCSDHPMYLLASTMLIFRMLLQSSTTSVHFEWKCFVTFAAELYLHFIRLTILILEFYFWIMRLSKRKLMLYRNHFKLELTVSLYKFIIYYVRYSIIRTVEYYLLL